MALQSLWKKNKEGGLRGGKWKDLPNLKEYEHLLDDFFVFIGAK